MATPSTGLVRPLLLAGLVLLAAGITMRVLGAGVGWTVIDRTGWATASMRVITMLGTKVGFLPVALAFLPVVGGLRAWWWRVAVPAYGAILLTDLIKVIVRDPRPDADALITASGFAFPSGHATTGGALIVIALLESQRLPRRALSVVVLAATTLAVLLPMSRLYLGVHEVQDVLAGLGLGIVVTLLIRGLTSRLAEWPRGSAQPRQR